MSNIRPTYDGVVPLLGLEATEGGWVRHLVDPARVRATWSRAHCGAVIRVPPVVEVLGVLDLTCTECETWWLAEFARIARARRVYSAP